MSTRNYNKFKISRLTFDRAAISVCVICSTYNCDDAVLFNVAFLDRWVTAIVLLHFYCAAFRWKNHVLPVDYRLFVRRDCGPTVHSPQADCRASHRTLSNNSSMSRGWCQMLTPHWTRDTRCYGVRRSFVSLVVLCRGWGTLWHTDLWRIIWQVRKLTKLYVGVCVCCKKMLFYRTVHLNIIYVCLINYN